jgi:glutathione synthase/RimK-type ligase-like ATP-grasp enzyme
MAKRYDRLAQALFNHFPAPLLRAEFVYADQWRLSALKPIAANDIPESHFEFLVEQAQRFLARPRVSSPKRARYDLAILYNPDEVDAPSDEKAIQRFIKAAGKVGIAATTIGKGELGRIAEYDALFIRETTAVNHHTYRFASRAEAEGLVVIDDPESIVRCTNKVYQAELFERHNVPCPRTLIVHEDNAKHVGEILGFPCVLKRPDSSFSAGVVKAHNPEELTVHLKAFFQLSDLIVAQEYVPSNFDWRVGVLDRRPLFACKYHMARGHWQIQKAESATKRRYGKVETVPVETVPSRVIELAVRASSLIGRGLYGLDIKELNGSLRVIEINDNPNIEAGIEDQVLGEELYLVIMRSFYARLERRGQEGRQ